MHPYFFLYLSLCPLTVSYLFPLQYNSIYITRLTMKTVTKQFYKNVQSLAMHFKFRDVSLMSKPEAIPQGKNLPEMT